MKKQTFRTIRDIRYLSMPYGYIATIPKGTRCDIATNIPKKDGQHQFWAKNWRGMTNIAKGWSYGFLIEAHNVTSTNAI